MIKMSDEDKPFVCSQPGCGMQFTNEDHLSVHIRKHDMSLALNLTPGGLSPLGLFSDMTPTPTKFLKNCEEMGLFQELSKNPFDDSFKKAMDEPIDHSNVDTNLQLPVTDCDNLDTPQPPLPKIVIGGEVIQEHGKQVKELSSIVPKKRKKFLLKSFSTSEDEDDTATGSPSTALTGSQSGTLSDSPSTALTGSSVDSNTDNMNNNLPVNVTEHKFVPTEANNIGNKPVKALTTNINVAKRLTPDKPTSQPSQVTPETTTTTAAATVTTSADVGSNLVIPVIVQLPTGQLVTLQVPASSLSNSQSTSTMQNNTIQLTNGTVKQAQTPGVLNITKSSVPNGNGPIVSVANVVAQNRLVQNNIPLTVKSVPNPSDNVQVLVNQPIIQNVVNQTGSQSAMQANLNQSNSQTNLQNLFNQSGTQAALQTILNQSRTQTILKPVINQTVSQSPLRVTVSQSGTQSGVVGMSSVLNISGLPGVLNQSNTQAALKSVLLPNKQIGLIASPPQGKVTQTVQSTSSTDPGNQSYAKQRLKAALQQQMTPSSGQKLPQIYQMVDVKKEPQTSPGVSDSRNITSPGAVSSPESGTSMRGSQLYDGNNDVDGSDPEGRRMKFLERNRAAAARCRQKRKRWVQELEQKADDLTSVNNKLCGEIKKLRGEVAQLKTMLLAHKDCPVTMQQRSQGQLNTMFDEDHDDITEISLDLPDNMVSSADSSLNNQDVIQTGNTNANQTNPSLPVGLLHNLGTTDQVPIVMNPISVITGPNSLAMIPKILNIDQSAIQTTSAGS